MISDTEKYKTQTWKSFAILHWLINPGLAVNELLFGQRIPKVTLIEKKSKKPLAERFFIPCPHCDTMHPGMKWSVQNGTAFKNWFGLYCDNCGKIIPCLWNFTSLIILAVTSPFWYWFKIQQKEKWLRKQREKFSKPLNLTIPNFKWWQLGLRFAVGYFIIDRFFTYLVMQEEFIWKKLVGNAIGAIIAGLIFGYLFRSMTTKKAIKQNNAGKQESI